MNKYSKEVLYKCLNNLIDGLYKDCLERKYDNNCFDQIKKELTDNNISNDFDYNFIYVYIITILLNNRLFFTNKFAKLSWDLPLHRFDSNSTINGYSVHEYGLMEAPTKEEIVEQEDAELLDNPTYLFEYQDYIDSKYRDSIYEPDDQEQIIFEEKYNFDHGIDYNPDDYYTYDGYSDWIEEEYNKALATLPEMLKNGDMPNINMIIQCIRNALAHSQFNITEDGLSMYSKDSTTGLVNFECVISNMDMIEILEKYIDTVFHEKKIVKIPYIMFLIFNDTIDGADKFGYDELKGILNIEFKLLNLENEYLKIINDVEEDIRINRNKYLGNHDKEDNLSEEEYLEVDRRIVLVNLVQNFFIKNMTIISKECKLLEILFILEDFDRQLEQNSFNIYKNHEYKHDDIIDLDNLEATIYQKYSWLYTIDISVDVKSFIAKIAVLLNLLFVQCSYENINKDQIDLSMMIINNEYLDEKNKIFSSQIEKIKAKCDKSLKKIDELNNAINSGRVGEEKQELLDAMKDDLWRMRANVSKLKSEWTSAISFNNSSIFNHIRNSFAHGSYTIQIPENEMDLKLFNIIIRDYEPETNKLTFSGTISIYDILTQILKPEIVHQLFDFEHKKNKSN